MITWFEKHSKLSWIITILIAIGIFYISSLTFESGSRAGSDVNAILYHIFAFFFLAFFLLISLIKGENKEFLFLGIAIAILYGVSDEFHQLFVSGRHSSFGDVFYDTAGILFASFLYISFVYRKKNNFIATE